MSSQHNMVIGLYLTWEIVCMYEPDLESVCPSDAVLLCFCHQLKPAGRWPVQLLPCATLPTLRPPRCHLREKYTALPQCRDTTTDALMGRDSWEQLCQHGLPLQICLQITANLSIRGAWQLLNAYSGGTIFLMHRKLLVLSYREGIFTVWQKPHNRLA